MNTKQLASIIALATATSASAQSNFYLTDLQTYIDSLDYYGYEDFNQPPTGGRYENFSLTRSGSVSGYVDNDTFRISGQAIGFETLELTLHFDRPVSAIGMNLQSGDAGLIVGSGGWILQGLDLFDNSPDNFGVFEFAEPVTEISFVNIHMSSMSARFDDLVIAYTVPACTPDVNGDGMLTPADFSAWLAAFNTMSPACDQNADDVCSPADFSAWVANYNNGC